MDNMDKLKFETREAVDGAIYVTDETNRTVAIFPSCNSDRVLHARLLVFAPFLLELNRVALEERMLEIETMHAMLNAFDKGGN